MNRNHKWKEKMGHKGYKKVQREKELWLLGPFVSFVSFVAIPSFCGPLRLPLFKSGLAKNPSKPWVYAVPTKTLGLI